MIDDPELVRRSILGFGEMLAALGRCAGVEVRRPDAIGARIEVAAYNHWYDAATVPLGATPPLDDLSIQYVATERSHRRRGLAGSLVSALLCEARASGLRSATLQASPEGLSAYERIGFRRLAPLRAYLRPPAARAQ
jgi:ribosomal protein S18 acetylase RimI-like enzyme